MPGVPKTFTMLLWCRQVLPRIKTARDIRGHEPMMFVYFQSIVAMCELLINRLTLKEMQRAKEENESRVTQQEKEEWIAACKKSQESLDPMKKQVEDALNAQKQEKAREEKMEKLRQQEENNRELCIETVRKVTGKQFTVASQDDMNVDLHDAENGDTDTFMVLVMIKDLSEICLRYCKEQSL